MPRNFEKGQSIGEGSEKIVFENGLSDKEVVKIFHDHHFDMPDVPTL